MQLEARNNIKSYKNLCETFFFLFWIKICWLDKRYQTVGKVSRYLESPVYYTRNTFNKYLPVGWGFWTSFHSLSNLSQREKTSQGYNSKGWGGFFSSHEE